MSELEKQNAARKAQIEAKISANADEISAMAKSELKTLLASTKYATPEKAAERLEEAENMLHRILGEPIQRPVEAPTPVKLTTAKPRMLSAEERAAAAKRVEKIFDEAEKESAQLRAQMQKIPLEEQKKQAKAAYKAGVYTRDEYALEMKRIGELEAAAKPAPEPKPEPKLPKGAYIAYQGATVGGEYVIVKDDRGNQASGETKAEAIRNLIAMREKPAETASPTTAVKTPMRGTEKQIAWSEKIIAQKKEAAIAAGISPREWEKVEEIITREGGAGAWIELRNTEPKHLLRVKSIVGMPEIEAKSPAQAVFARGERVKKIATVDEWIGQPPHSPDKTEQARRMALHERYVQATLREMGKETSAREWIDAPVNRMILRVRPAAVEAAKSAAPQKTAAEKAAELEKYANMSAKELAAEYADGMAKIIGKHAEFAIEMMDGAEYAINAAADKAASILQNRATKWTQTVTENVANMLAEGAKSSESPLKVAEELESAGIAHAETVARTEMARAREMANLDIMKAQNVEKVQFIASEDERMCPICGQYHGKIYDVSSAPVLPLHPNCRCTLVPYIPEEL